MNPTRRRLHKSRGTFCACSASASTFSFYRRYVKTNVSGTVSSSKDSFFLFFLNPADGERSRKETTWAKKMVLWYTVEWWRFPITRQTRRRGGKKKGTNGTVRLDYRQCIEAPTRTISSSLPTSAAGRVAAFFFPFAIIGSFQNSHTAAEWNRNNNSNNNPKRKVTFNAVVYIYTLYGRQWLRPAFQILIRKNQVPYFSLPPSRLDF